MPRLSTIWEEEAETLSWSRVFSSFTVLTSIWALVHVVLKTHAIPDAATLAGLGVWAVFPYGVNKISGIPEALKKG